MEFDSFFIYLPCINRAVNHNIFVMSNLNSTESNILKAAEDVFLEKGYALAKTTEIAGKAGVTHAMLHYYYRTKEKIFLKIFEKKLQELLASLEIQLPKDIPFIEQVRLGVEAHFDFIASNPRIPRFLLQEVSDNADRTKEIRKLVEPVFVQMLSEVTQRIERAVEAGEIRRVDPIHLLFDIASLNVFVFLALPTLHKVVGLSKKEYKEFLEKRKTENVELILSRIRI